MNGKVLDVSLIAALAIAFCTVAVVHPGLGNAVIAWVGLVGLGYYNSFIRHDPGLEPTRRRPGYPVDHHETLRAFWR